MVRERLPQHNKNRVGKLLKSCWVLATPPDRQGETHDFLISLNIVNADEEKDVRPYACLSLAGLTGVSLNKDAPRKEV